MAILGFRHKGLELFFTKGRTSKIQAQHAPKLRLILGRLNAAAQPRDMALPGLVLHPLKGDREGTWSVRVSGNWRVTFEFVGPDVDRVDYEDYH
jgi:toxin HigB-1